MSKRSELNFESDRTDWIVHVIPNQIECILRLKKAFKRKEKAKPKIKPLLLSDLALININLLKEQVEKNAIANAKKCFYISSMLSKSGDYRDAYLYLHLSLEHAVKIILIKSKYAYDKKYLDSIPVVHDTSGKDVSRSHEIAIIIAYLLSLIPELRTKTKIGKILSVLSTTKKHGHWSEIRYYADPENTVLQKDFEQFVISLRKAVIPFYKDLRNNGILK